MIDGPYRADWFDLLPYFFAVAIASFLLGILFGIQVERRAQGVSFAGWEGTWMSKEEIERIARYHGPYHKYMITSGEMILYRGGEQIVVKRRYE